MTAYKYVARDAESRVNWGDISKTWSDAILKVEADREAKRQTIKTETDELANKLIEAPRGQHQGANEWTAGYADMQREALLERYRQLTSGNLALRDWNSSLANATQSTEQMFNLSKVYQEEYASIMERDQNMESQEAELALAAEFEGFTNFTETVPLVDPVTLSAKIGRQVYDPETGTYKVGETITMNGMYNLLKGRYNRFDIQAAAAADVKTLGKYTTVIMDGKVKTRENWQDDPLYNEELDAKIDVHFSDPQNITSVLTNAMDSGYSTTGLLDNALDREGNVDDKKVFWVTNPAQASAGAKTPLISLDIELDDSGNIVGRSEAELDNIFGEDVSDEKRVALVRAANEQRKQAKEFMRTYYTAEVDKIETAQTQTGGAGTGLTDAQRKAMAAREQTINAAQHWMNLAFAPTPEQKTTSAGALQGLKFEDEYGSRQTIVGVDPLTLNDRVILTLRDGEGKETTVERIYAESPAAEQWVSQGNFFYEDPAAAENLVRSLQNREEGPAFGNMTLGVKATGRAFAEEVVDIIPFGEATIGTGKSAAAAPVYFSENSDPGNAESEAAATTAAVKAALGAMGVDSSGITQITEAASQQYASENFYNEQETIRFHIPGVTPKSIFVPNNQAGINALADMMSMLPNLIKNREQLTVKEALEKFSNVPKFEDYNGEKFGDTMRNNFGITEAPRSTNTGGGTPPPPAPRPGG
jgi:hypothetical protein